MSDIDEIIVTATVPTYVYNPLIGTGTSISPSSPYTAPTAQSSWHYKQYLKQQAEKKLKQLQDDIDAIDMSHLLSDEDPLLELAGYQIIFDDRSGSRTLNIDDIVITIPSHILGDITINPESSNYAHYVKAYHLGSNDYTDDNYIAMERVWVALKDTPTPLLEPDGVFVQTGDSTAIPSPGTQPDTVTHVVDYASKTIVNVTDHTDHVWADGMVTLTVTKNAQNEVYLVVGEIREIKNNFPEARNAYNSIIVEGLDAWEGFANHILDQALEMQNPIPEL